MKRMLTTTFTLLTFGACLYALSPYDGPKDDNPWTDAWGFGYHSRIETTSLGVLARYADIIAVGEVSNRADTHFTVTVDHAVIGCTNGQSMVVYEFPYSWNSNYRELNNYIPSNNSRIVFAVYTNAVKTLMDAEMYEPSPDGIVYYEQSPQLIYYNRSWWNFNRDDSVLFTQFTNVIQAVRVERNWTNYFHLCRDGANSTSNRVREDSWWDLIKLGHTTTDEQAQLILDDPLVGEMQKNWIRALHRWGRQIPDEYWEPQP